jgi:hypothetical protein
MWFRISIFGIIIFMKKSKKTIICLINGTINYEIVIRIIRKIRRIFSQNTYQIFSKFMKLKNKKSEKNG